MKHIVWLVVALMMFSWGHTEGEYEGQRLQASYGRFRCEHITTTVIEYNTCMKFQPHELHQYEPFPLNLMDALSLL